MKTNLVKIAQIRETIAKSPADDFAVVWVKSEVHGIDIDNVVYRDIANSIFFIDAKYKWKILKENDSISSGYILYLSREVLESPNLSNLHINKVRLFNSGEIPLFKLSPGIEKRIQAILEMVDELLGSNLNHRDDAILSLVNTFFVYCDGQCNIRSVVSKNNSKARVVYRFKKLVDQFVVEKHEVTYYAQLLNVTPKYLNECVKEVLCVSSKSIIIEQLLMRSRHALKFSNQTIKEISSELGFSSPDYFSYFFKTHTGSTPSTLRRG